MHREAEDESCTGKKINRVQPRNVSERRNGKKKRKEWNELSIRGFETESG